MPGQNALRSERSRGAGQTTPLVEFTAVNLPDGSIIDYQSPHRIHRWGLFDAYDVPLGGQLLD